MRYVGYVEHMGKSYPKTKFLSENLKWIDNDGDVSTVWKVVLKLTLETQGVRLAGNKAECCSFVYETSGFFKKR
jgi:hypothetical protein